MDDDSTSLMGRVAIVTGAGRGIGRAIAGALAEQGVRLVLVGRTAGPNPGSVETAADQIRDSGGSAVAVRADLAAEGAAKLIHDATITSYGWVDVVINNAARFGGYRSSWELPWTAIGSIFDTNVRGLFELTSAVIPHLRERGGGSIVNLTSSTAELDGPMGTDVAYAMSKAAVNRLTTFLAEEVRQFNIAVNALDPQSLLTDGAVAALGPDFDFSGYAPPDAIGEAVCFLARCRAEFTGHVVPRRDVVGGAYCPGASQSSSPEAVDGLRHRFRGGTGRPTSGQS